jgi:hypothetical protein
MTVWINGTQVYTDSETHGTYKHAVSIDTSAMVVGVNVIAIRGDDQSSVSSGNYAYFDFLLEDA